MTSGSRARTQRDTSAVSRPCSWAARRPHLWTTSTTRWRASSRNTPTVTISAGRRLTISAARWGATWRGEGAKTNPTASAPMATASSASSSLVTPQTFTNTARKATHTG